MEQQRRLRDGDSVLVQIGEERLLLEVIADRAGRTRRLIVRSDADFKLNVFHGRCDGRRSE